MRVLVTGASGLIGAAVCDALLARGDEVVGLSRNPEKARQRNPAMRWFAWNSTEERPPPEALDEVDGVVNLIGETINQRWTEAAKQRIMDTRVVSTRNLLAGVSASRVNPRVFVGQAAVGYYGDRGEAMVDEDSSPGDDFGAQVVVEWEAAERDAESQGMRTVIFRSGHVLSRDGGLLKQLLPPFKLGVGGPIGEGNQYMSWISIDDEVGLILWALDNEEVSGTINATAPNPVPNKDFARALGDALGRPAAIRVPGFALNLMRGREMAEVIKGGQRVMPRRAMDLGYNFRHSELGPALEAALS